MSWFQKKEPAEKSTRLRSLDVVQSYGLVLETCPYGVGNTMPEDKLPFDKEIIKGALVDIATMPGYAVEQVSKLKSGFLELASFRFDGGLERKITKANPPETGPEIANFLQRHGDEIKLEEQLAALVLEEMALLADEWTLRIKILTSVKNA